MSLHLFDGVVWAWEVCGYQGPAADKGVETWGSSRGETMLERGNRPCARGDGLRLVRPTRAVVAQAQTVRLRRRWLRGGIKLGRFPFFKSFIWEDALVTGW